MAALAVNGVDGLVADDLELRSADGPSYTAETLERLRCGSGLTSTQIFFITGADAFAEIETWHRYPEVLDLAHFVVVSRPGCPVAGLPARVPALAPRMIADTARLERERTPSVFLLDARTRDVSSTEIRRRIAGNESIDGMVPAAVAAHILQHGLYRPAAHSTSADHLHGED
jgi:nicotinate-nucleotide adenylyltransferase